MYPMSVTGLYDRITRGGGSVSVTADGSITFAPAAGKNATLSSGGLVFGTTAGIFNDAANVLSQRNGANAQAWRLFKTYTDVSNGEWLEAAVTGSTWILQTNQNGSGQARNLYIQAGSGIIQILTSGKMQFGPNTNFEISTDNSYGGYWNVDGSAALATRGNNQYDIGTVGHLPRTGYFGTSVVSPLFSLTGAQTYAASNVTTDRTYDANATTLDEVADVLGTLIADLRAGGLVL